MTHCPACQHANPAQARFCNQCGQALAQAAPASTNAAPASPNPRAYTPRHLADRILHNAHSLKGERKQVTVLFADVKGSTRLAEQAGAERWHQILDQLFSLLSGAVHRFEGSVNQYTGDGIMALFGAPIAHEDHGLRAAHAALAMREQVRSFADELRLRDGLNLSLRVGLNSGEVIVGAIGDDLRMDYTAQGHTVNLAARMEAIAEPGRVYLTRNTAKLLEGYFRMRDLGETSVQGVDAPLRVYELEDVGEIATRLELSQSRGLSRFVGRQRELEQLEALVESVREQGAGRVVSVSGNAGIGKSRLCHEFIQRCRARGISVHTASAVPYADAMPYFPVQQLLRGYFGIAENDDATAARRKVAGALLLQDDSARDALALVFDFLGLGLNLGDDAQPNNSPPELRMQRLQALCSQALAAKSEFGVVLLEDVHWADAGSVEFFQHMFACAAGSPLLIVCNHRSDYVLEWLWQGADQEIALDALDTQAIDDLLGELLGAGDGLAPLRNLIRERAAGNPYFVEEAVYSLLENDSLTGVPGSYILNLPLDQLRIPDSVQAILAARIDRLPARDKQTLHAAAVLGKTFHETWLAGMLAREDEAWHESLRNLVESGFVHPEGEAGDSYEFCHPLMQEVAYAEQLGETRRAHHTRAAEVLQAQIDPLEQPGESAVLLAHHWRQAQAWAEAAQWDLQAASWLLQHDVRATLERFRLAIAATDRLDQTDANVRHLAVSARAGVVRAASIIDIPDDEVERAYRQARAMVEADNDQADLAELLLSHGIHVLNQGDARQAAELVDEGVAIIQATGDQATLSRFRIPVLNVYFTSGALAEGLRVLGQADDWATQAIDLENFASRALRGVVLGYQGDLPAAYRELQTTIQVAEAHNSRVSWIHANVVEMDYLSGNGDNSLHHAQLARAVAEEFGSPFFASMADRALAVAYFLRGDYPLALDLLEASRPAVARGAPGHQFEGVHLALMAELQLKLGRITAAKNLADQALKSSLAAGARLWEIRSRLAIAETLVAAGDAQAAFEEQADVLEDLIQDTGATIFNGCLYAVQARACQQWGQAPSAQSSWLRAQQAFTDAGAQAKAEQAGRSAAAYNQTRERSAVDS